MSDKPENVILRLRPVSGKAVDLPAALAAATTAAAEQEQAVVRARAGRDDALLDAAPSALRQAEQVLAAAREQVERINAIASNLQSRYRTAVEAETLANVADLKAQIEAAEAKLSKWWQRQRHELVTVFTEGLTLGEAATNLRANHQYARMGAMQSYPSAEIGRPVVQHIDDAM